MDTISNRTSGGVLLDDTDMFHMNRRRAFLEKIRAWRNEEPVRRDISDRDLVELLDKLLPI